MTSMKSLRAASYPALIGFTLALTSACGGYSVNYDGARGAKRAKSDITFYEIDCREPTLQTQDCQYNGSALPWKTLGVFRAPKKATSDWGKYRGKVADSASMNGCPAVAIRKMPPNGDGIGAFCVDPASAGAAAPPPGGPGIGISVSATATAGTTECNAASDCPPGMKCARGTCGP
jgi:hypothetical protein